MRSAVVAMLMAGALAAPSAHRAHMRIHQERDAQPNEVIVTATAYTTVMQGAAPTVAPAPAAHEAKVVTVQQPQAPAPAAPAVPAAPSAYKPPAPIQASGPAPSVPAPSAPASGSSDTSGLNAFQKSALETHNLHRSNHSAPALTYDKGLEAAAQKLANNCMWGEGEGQTHDTSIDKDTVGAYGQNAACGADIATVITGMWYNNELGMYNAWGSEPSMSGFKDFGHFTQLVWKSSTKVGCAIAQCPNGVQGFPSSKSKAICNYASPGNFAGQYAQNVLPALGHPVSTANAGNVINT